MVLSLVELSLAAVRNTLENGVYVNTDQLSVPLREKLLNFVLMHGTINEPACLRALSSPEFLQGFSSFNTQRGHVDDHQYLDRVTTTIAKHKSIGQEMKDLRLTIYRGYIGQPMIVCNVKEMNIQSVVQLIASCPRLESLSLAFFNYSISHEAYDEIGPTMFNLFSNYSDFRGFLNDVFEMRLCRTILSNLTELTLSGCGQSMTLFVKDHPIIRFKNLNTLVLSNVTVYAEMWKKFLMVIRNKLTRLHLDQVSVVDGPTLPIPLPCLDKLVIHGVGAFKCDPIFMANLKQCHQLKYVSLELTEEHNNEECLEELSRVDILSEMKIRLDLDQLDPSDKAIFDDSSRLKLVCLFGEKITSVSIYGENWAPPWTAAMEHIVQTCHDLTELIIDVESITEESERELSKANLALVQLFSSKERASKLRKLHLIPTRCDFRRFQGFASNVLNGIFKNCVNVESLVIWCCDEFSDEHCREWARRGGKLTSFDFFSCNTITDDGILPILETSGNHLKYCSWGYCKRITNRSFAFLFEHCRYLKKAWIPEDMNGNAKKCISVYASRKCFNVLK